MSLDTFTGLVDAIADWLNRRDLTARIPDFIRLAEDDINTRLRDRGMEGYVEVQANGQPIPLPADFAEAVRITTTIGNRPLTPTTLHELQRIRGSWTSVGGAIGPWGGGAFGGGSWGGGYSSTYLGGTLGLNTGMKFAVAGNMLEVWPLPQTTLGLAMVYRAKLPRLTAEAPTNWLLQDDAAIYLYGALAMAEPYLRNDARLATWAQLYTDRVNNRNAASDVAVFAGGPLKRRRRGFG